MLLNFKNTVVKAGTNRAGDWGIVPFTKDEVDHLVDLGNGSKTLHPAEVHLRNLSRRHFQEEADQFNEVENKHVSIWVPVLAIVFLLFCFLSATEADLFVYLGLPVVGALVMVAIKAHTHDPFHSIFEHWK
jgi:hypothetical protein